MPRGASSSPASQRWLWNSRHCSVGPHNDLFKGLPQRGAWGTKATLSVVTQEPQVLASPSSRQPRMLQCSPADTQGIAPATPSRGTCRKPVPQGPHKASMP